MSSHPTSLRSEVVDPARQGCQQFPALVRQALREGWATPDASSWATPTSLALLRRLIVPAGKMAQVGPGADSARPRLVACPDSGED
jgi:hypothetical protein